MKGENIMEGYRDTDPEYFQTLCTAGMVIGDDNKFFGMLVKAEEQGKRLEVVEELGEFAEPGEVRII